jgi:hypothetical protein
MTCDTFLRKYRTCDGPRPCPRSVPRNFADDKKLKIEVITFTKTRYSILIYILMTIEIMDNMLGMKTSPKKSRTYLRSKWRK